MKKNILIVEDEETIVNFIKNRLKSDVYNVDIAYDGKVALNKIAKNSYDLITLDIMLPHVDGFEICQRIRKNSKQTLVIMISALDTIEFKTKGYDYGIDDYIAKPFSAKELAIKIQSLLKRKEEISFLNAQSIVDILLNEEAKEILINGFNINFTPSEYLILATLINNKNRVYSRAELAQIIYDNYFGEIDEQGINSHIYHIREKVKQFYDKDIIKTVRGMGYKIYEN
ncbi:MAG TPA: response regulator transcription factor [Sulfurospirillum arcachonense]|nr:response regulator transcription factor [Sulfurospirillum arcachonense]HIP45877.1 response regulator transcription factor [Sulfurospirillum arcachonense]